MTLAEHRYFAKYVALGTRPASPEELYVRRISQELKIPTADAVAAAALCMSTLIDGPCWLIPVPDSTGSLNANLALARHIAAFVSGARVKTAIARTRPVESSCQRRLRGLPGLTPAEHHIIRTAGPLLMLPAYFVDNVVTTGNTLAACKAALGWGDGLVYADASSFSTACAIH